MAIYAVLQGKQKFLQRLAVLCYCQGACSKWMSLYPQGTAAPWHIYKVLETINENDTPQSKNINRVEDRRNTQNAFT